MNEIIESLLSRRSVRVFEERAIPAAEKEAILLAAVNAPTAGNQQLYTTSTSPTRSSRRGSPKALTTSRLSRRPRSC